MPDLTELFRSQPGWVVIAVILIIAAAYVLRPVLARDRDEDDEPPAGQAAAAAPTGGPGQTYEAIYGALDRLALTATREGARGDAAERERDDYARQLRQALADLAECERATAGPIRDAHRYADRRDPATTYLRQRHGLAGPDDAGWPPRDRYTG